MYKIHQFKKKKIRKIYAGGTFFENIWCKNAIKLSVIKAIINNDVKKLRTRLYVEELQLY